MGYNQSDKDLVMRHLDGMKNVLDIGACIDYSVPLTENPIYISDWYKSLGIKYSCIDLAGDNGAMPLNLAIDIEDQIPCAGFSIPKGGWDLTVDAGTKEHLAFAKEYPVTSFHNGKINSVYPLDVVDALSGFHSGWENQFLLTKKDGKLISINPETGSWPSHCYHWVSNEFYLELESIADVKIVELYRDAACNNTTDGWNITCVLKKTGNNFPSFEEFSKLPIYTS